MAQAPQPLSGARKAAIVLMKLGEERCADVFKHLSEHEIEAVVREIAVLGVGSPGGASEETVAFIQTFAAGAILTMLADTMMPHAYQYGGKLVGVVTTLGFATAVLIHALE